MEFDKTTNLIQGRNHTGKSSLIKALFLTLGARPRGELTKWDEGTISLVDFRVGEQKYRALHQSGTRALFAEDGRLIVATGSHGEWSDQFASATGFNLVLSDKKGESVPADPKCFFLPFYINQDGSWQSGWDTFSGLQQFTSPIGPILEYFSGIKPPEYYEAKAKRDSAQRVLDDLKRERSFLDKVQERFGKKLIGPKIDPENFTREIEILTSDITDLNLHQEKLRDQVVRERELLSSIYLQINMANEALRVYDSDLEYIRSEPREKLVCPVCNAEHAESFMDVLTYAEDARSLRSIAFRLQGDARLVETQMQTTVAEIGALDVRYRKIAQLLDTRRGDLQFRHVVEGLGAEQAFQAFSAERQVLEREISTHLSEVDHLSSSMSDLTDRKRSAAIQDRFREAYASALFELNMPPSEKSRLTLNSRPSVSGSGGPRSILAYYAALWDVCCSQTGSFLIPLVVDSPNQQGQDDINLPKVIAFVSTKLPKNTQLIVCSEIEVHFPFNSRTVLDRPYQLLDEASFGDIEAEIEPLMRVMYAASRSRLEGV